MSIFSFFEDWNPLIGGFYVMNDGLRNLSAIAVEAMSTTPCRRDDGIELINCRDDAVAIRLKMIAIVTILTAGVIGVSIPLIGKKRKFLSTNSGLFVFFKAFAAGVILATGFVHMLPDGQKALTDPCLPKSPWSDFPFSGFVAMIASLGTLVLDFLATQFYEKKHRREEDAVGKISSSAVADEDGITVVVEAMDDQEGSCSDDSGRIRIVGMHEHAAANGHSNGDGDRHGPDLGQGQGHGHGGHAHSHTHALEEDSGDGPSSHVRHIVISQILEMGIVSHSVIIGLSLGLSHSTCTIRPLIGALSFHQFFEGFALGGCISQAHLSNLAATLMACFFAVTTPTGIAAGSALSSFYDSNSPLALVIEGVFDCISAGILIYMALVDLIAVDFSSRNMRCNVRLQLSSYLALFMGAGSMSILALWA